MQSRRSSFAECVISTAFGFVVSMIAYAYILPLYDIHISMFQNVQIVAIFTIISIIRQYIFRRIFNNFTIRSSHV